MCRRNFVTRWQHIDGQGAVCFEPDGRVRLVVSDEVAEVFAAAQRAGTTPDDLVNQLIERAQAEQIAAGTGPVDLYEEPVPDFS